MKTIRTLEAGEIEARVGQIFEGKGLTLLLYKDARVDMSVLDEVFGPMNWQKHYELIDGKIFCTVEIWDDQKGQWISKQDVGTESFTEAEKGQASDAFKRACVNVGIGRELYSAPFIWIPAEKVAIVKSPKGKATTRDKFKVNVITYDDKRKISTLQIKNQKGEVVFNWSGAKK